MAEVSYRDVISQIKSTVDIVDYIQGVAISLNPSSGGKFKGLCPFHAEKTPSFIVDTNFQNYRCFGCGANGDLISFVCNYENLSFHEAVVKLAETANIELSFGDEDSDGYKDYKKMRECVKDAALFFRHNFKILDDDHRAKREITSRGLSLDGMMYGYAPDGKNNLYRFLKKRGFSDDIILKVNVCGTYENSVTGKDDFYDFWRGRLMFIITDAAGNPVGFSGRKLFDEDKRGKYVNSPKSPIFNKSAVLFNHFSAKTDAKNEGAIFVAEGQFDVAAIMESGVANVVASSGTAFTHKQLLMCTRMVGENGKVIFCFDGDEAGRNAAYKVFALAGDLQSQCYVVTLPDNLDPCDFLQREGADSLYDILHNEAQPLVRFVLDVIASRYDLHDEGSVSKYLEEASVVLKTIMSISLRSKFMSVVALTAMVPLDTVEEVVKNAKYSKTLPDIKPDSSNEEPDSDRLVALSVTQKERELMDWLCREDSPVASMCQRILRLTFENRALIPECANMKYVHPAIRSLALEAERLDGGPIIPEKFKYPLVVSKVITEDYFPYINLMSDEDVEELFWYICDRLKNEVANIKKRKHFRKVVEALSKDSGTEVEVLEMFQNKDLEV